MTSPYPIDTDTANPGESADAGGVWLYCPVCAATYPVAPLSEAPCPNTDQHEPTDIENRTDDCEEGPAMARTIRSTRAAARATARDRRDPDTTTETGAPSVAEIAALTSRLRHLHSPDATEAERAAFLADKHALLARIAAADPNRKD